MAGEKFIALEETSQEIKSAVEGVQTDVTGVRDSDLPGIDTLIDAIIARIGTAEDTGDTVLGRLKTLMNSGGGWSNFKYKNIVANRTTKTYTASNGPGILIGECSWDSDSTASISVNSGNGGVVYLATVTNTQTSSSVASTKASAIGFFVKGAEIKAYSGDKTATVHIFEFI